MSRSKRDILDTESMLERLCRVLYAHRDLSKAQGSLRTDAEALRRISMTLHRWHEMECGDGNDRMSWTIARGRKDKGGAFEYADDGKPYLECHSHQGAPQPVYRPMVDRERGALKRLKAIMARYPVLSSYVQGDPRGCALYILKPGDVPAGEDVSAYYSRGLAVYQ